MLVVAHKGSVDICTRLLRGLPPQPQKTFKPSMDMVPYCGMACLEETSNPKLWKLVKPPIHLFTHDSNNYKNKKYSWDIWL